MEAPFIYGRIVTDENFIDREVETTNLVWNFVSLSNTIIISPRWLIYDSQTQKIGESYNWFHCDCWYSISEFIDIYSNRKWVRDA